MNVVQLIITIYSLLLCTNFLNSALGSFITQKKNMFLTNHGKSGGSDQSKRNIYRKKLDVLIINIQFTTGERTDLKLYKRSQHLANKYLPVVTPMLDHNTKVMSDFGEFVSYQDISRCAALVYFEKTNSFYGAIGMNYYVSDLPDKFNANGIYPVIVGEPYVMKREYTPVHIHPIKITPLLPNYAEVPQCSSESSTIRTSLPDLDDHVPDPDDQQQHAEHDFSKRYERDLPRNDIEMGHNRTRRERPDIHGIFYLEILVLITCDIADIFKRLFGNDKYIEQMIYYYILYFNAIDMMYQKLPLSHRRLQINIAQIEIEDEIRPFEFMTDDHLEFDKVVEKVPQYFHAYSSSYPPDSFDLVFIQTNRPILHHSIQVHGATKHGDDLYEAKIRNKFYDAVPIIVLGFQEDYAVAVQEIGHIFDMKIDSWFEGLKGEGQCYSIMQDGSSRCDKCLRWSDANLKQFQAFFKKNRNRCVLLNYPRSILPPGASPLVNANKLCKCYGYDSHTRTTNGHLRQSIGARDCSKNLRCQNGIGSGARLGSTIPPSDGTPCGHAKVCWEGECVPYPAHLCKLRI